jgi:hypothetical protein
MLLRIVIHKFSSFNQFGFLNLKQRINIIYNLSRYHHKLTHISIWLGKCHNDQIDKNPKVKERQVQKLLSRH